jgi:hypothetical protein
MSKSLEFEKLFQKYVHSYISPNLHYLSVIRPLTSVAVAKIFADYPKYFDVFSSDNSHFKIEKKLNQERWSLDSPKSLSSFILLAPWISNEDLNRTFTRNFLDISSLEKLFLRIVGIEGNPVLDCVGTPSELRLSLSLLADQGRMSNTILMTIAKNKNLLLKDFAVLLNKALSLDNEHVIPKQLADKILPLMKEKLS